MSTVPDCSLALSDQIASPPYRSSVHFWPPTVPVPIWVAPPVPRLALSIQIMISRGPDVPESQMSYAASASVRELAFRFSANVLVSCLRRPMGVSVCVPLPFHPLPFQLLNSCWVLG